ncbi:MAG: hypothetical protein KJ007_05795 [Burkholderiales bacterium]|nr:hypothetical protein [Burkholderiales bacterium]
MNKPLMLTLAVLSAFSATAHSAEPETEAVEYYNRSLNHYFITATAAEARMIDDGAAGEGWVRTGRSFQAWLDPAGAPANASAVCRFYSRGANSHFYTANAGECEYLKGLESEERRAALSTGAAIVGWQYEGVAFRIESPAGDSCPAGTAAISRVYNNGFASGEGANHRFVDDSELRALMLDRAWVGEGVAFCARTKAGGTNANLPPTSTNFDALAADWSGTARWKTQAGAAETRISAPLSLAIASDGRVSGSGQGCSFTGQVQRGDGFRSLFTGTLSASGCASAAFNGAYGRFRLERYASGTLAVDMKRGDGANEASVEAMLSAGAITTNTPGTTPASVTGVAGSWAGTVGWTALRRQGGIETILVTSNRPLAVAITSTGALTGSGFGCALSGSLSPTSVAGRFAGTLAASGCTEPAFNGTYAEVGIKRDDGGLEVEFEREAESAGVTTKAKVEGRLANADTTPTTPTTPVTPPAGIAASYQGDFTATIEIRNRANGGDTTTSSSETATLRFAVASNGALSGTGFGCQFAGSLSLTDAVARIYTGTISASGCTNATHAGRFAASAHPEDGGALQLEMERESEAANVRTKVKFRGTASRTAP